MRSALSWFEIPTVDLTRAVSFYEAILQEPLKHGRFGEVDIAVFKAEEPGVAGALILSPTMKPGIAGTRVYLNANGKLDEVLGRVASSGGKVLLGRTSIGKPGFIAVIEDTEGNPVGLHEEAVR